MQIVRRSVGNVPISRHVADTRQQGKVVRQRPQRAAYRRSARLRLDAGERWLNKLAQADRYMGQQVAACLQVAAAGPWLFQQNAIFLVDGIGERSGTLLKSAQIRCRRTPRPQWRAVSSQKVARTPLPQRQRCPNRD